MTISFGSAQTNGLPILVTALLVGSAQLVHTFPAGSGTPDIVRLYAQNYSATQAAQLTVVIKDSGATVTRQFTVGIPVGGGVVDVFNGQFSDDGALIQNGASTVSVFADVASIIGVTASVNNQSSTAGSVQGLFSGLVAAVQNANRFAIGTQAGTGTATEANANYIAPRAGTIKNLYAKPDAAVGSGAVVTVAVRKNGASTALSVTFNNADGTTAKTDTDAVAFVAGDLLTFMVACDNGAAPASNLQAAAEIAWS